MEAISAILAEYGMTGVLILVLIFAIRAIYNQAKTEEKESSTLEREFRSYLMSTQGELTQIIKGNTEAFKEFSKTMIETNYANKQAIKELNELKNSKKHG